MSRRVQNTGKRPLDLIEESIALLRSIPASAYLAYYIGVAPFWLAFLYFVADMSHGAFAGDRLMGGSLALAALFVWMKCWQSVFASKVEAQVLLRPDVKWSLARVARLVSTQVSLQPPGLFLRPIALVITLPFVWVSAFFQNVSVLGDGDAEGKSVGARAARQALLWSGQVHLATVWLFIFALFVFVNVLSAFFLAPAVLKMFFDLETEASRHSAVVLNSTSLAAAFAITMMCVDPIFKALFVLRCFHGESIRTGLDLRVQLRRLKQGARIAVVLMSMLAGGGSKSLAAETPPPHLLPKEELRESIREVLQRREYAWRMPPSDAKADKENSASKWLLDKVIAWRKWFYDWMRKLSKRKTWSANSSGSAIPVEALAYFLVAVALGLIVVGAIRHLRQNKKTTEQAQPVIASPDLNSDDVTADQLPEDGWLDLMQRALAEGENRAAIRAAYLACLAHLGQRQLLTIARHKSNRDYDRELGRRARTRGELLAAFRENLQAFERVWYGEHEVTGPAFEQFRHNLDVIRSC